VTHHLIIQVVILRILKKIREDGGKILLVVAFAIRDPIMIKKVPFNINFTNDILWNDIFF